MSSSVFYSPKAKLAISGLKVAKKQVQSIDHSFWQGIAIGLISMWSRFFKLNSIGIKMLINFSQKRALSASVKADNG